MSPIRKGGSAVASSDLSTLPNLPQLDDYEPLEALELVRHLREWLHLETEGQMLRARSYGLSWRTIASAAGVNQTTTRRWVLAGLPDQIRRRS